MHPGTQLDVSVEMITKYLLIWRNPEKSRQFSVELIPNKLHD